MEYEYERYSEPYSYEVRERRVRIARGLQAVDGLETSAAFEEPAARYVAGQLDADGLTRAVDAYYNQKVGRAIDRYSQEADLVGSRICFLLDGNGFTFSPSLLQHIHQQLFRGLMDDPYYEHNFREYNFIKREFVLAGESVEYGDFKHMEEDLEAAFDAFELPPYDSNDPKPYAQALAGFITRVWQIHPFAEGNTRTTAVFLMKLLRNRGFDFVTNDLFERYSLHFRNALVRACYANDALGVRPDSIYIDRFVTGLLENSTEYPYRNRDMASRELYAAKGMAHPADKSGLIG